jgi:hypothetical protein
LSGNEFALQDQFTDAYQGPRLLGIHVRNDAELLGGGYRSEVYRRAYHGAKILVPQCIGGSSRRLCIPFWRIGIPSRAGSGPRHCRLSREFLRCGPRCLPNPRAKLHAVRMRLRRPLTPAAAEGEPSSTRQSDPRAFHCQARCG